MRMQLSLVWEMRPQAMIFRPENLEGGTWPAGKQISRGRAACGIFALLLLMLGSAKTVAAQNDVMGELQFEGKTKVERDSGVWIDGNYVGYLKELNGSKKVTLLPGQHEVVVRQSGYQDYVAKIVVAPGQKRLVSVTMHLAPSASVPEITSTLKLKIKPKR